MKHVESCGLRCGFAECDCAFYHDWGRDEWEIVHDALRYWATGHNFDARARIENMADEVSRLLDKEPHPEQYWRG